MKEKISIKMISNNEYYKLLKQKKEELSNIREDMKTITCEIIGKTLCDIDLYFCATIDRCIKLIDGMINMLDKRNLTCTGALLRLQMDNCMRTYAFYIAEDKNKIVNCILKGKQINKQRDCKGNDMSDSYLKSQLDKMDGRFGDVYKQTSGFIHLSEKAFYQTVGECENNILKLQVGAELPEKRNIVLLECADAFIHYCKLNFDLLQPVVDSKRKYDKE